MYWSTAAQLLKQSGHKVTMAEGGVQALEILRSDTYDLVLLDLLMPDLDSLEVLSNIKADPRLLKIPVIMVSGEESESMTKCIEAGAVSYLSKPVDATLLAEQIVACLH